MKELSQKEKYLLNINRIHMIGIGGSGMCPLAEILDKKGYQISGSDNNESDPLKRVRTFAKVSLGHKKENVLKLKELYDVDVVVKPDENIKKGKFEIKIDKTYEDILEELKNKN